MPLVTNEKIDLIRSKIDIISLLSEYLVLVKRGRNYWAVCPFHQDSHPSMSISPEKQIYRCFTCSAGGNIFTFLQEHEKITFIQALRILADRAGIELNELTNYQEKSIYDDLDNKIFELNELAKAFFVNNLFTKKGTMAKGYLLERKITEDEITTFEIGFSDDNLTSLATFLTKKGYSVNEQQQAGLVNLHNGKVIDHFNDRIMFPIKNVDGKIIGFSGRIFSSSSKKIAKYINSPETKVFLKDHLMYNIQRAISPIRQKGKIILLEGYMDVISLERINIQNIVAIMGTNLSDYHLKEIKKLTNECVIFLDGDNAGISASLKISQKLLANNFRVKVVLNQTGKDPDELVNSDQVALIHEMLNSAAHPVNFAIDYYKLKYNLNDTNDLEQFIKIIQNLINAIGDHLEQEAAINNLAKITGILPATIAEKILVKKIKPQLMAPIIPQKNTNINSQKQLPKIVLLNQNSTSKIDTVKKINRKIKNLKRYMLAEEGMVLQLISSRAAIDFYQLKVGNLNNYWYRMLANTITEYYNKYLDQQNVDIEILCNEINDSRLNTMLLGITNTPTIKTKYNKIALEDYALLIEDYATANEIVMLWNKLEKATIIEEQQSISMEIDKMNQRLKFKKG